MGHEKTAPKQLIAKLQRRVEELEKFKSETKKLAQKLETSEKEKAAILNALFEYVLLANRNYEILWTNKAVNEQFGMEPEQIRGMRCYKLFNGLDRPCKNCHTLRAVKNNEIVTVTDCKFLGRIWTVRHYPLVGEDKVLATYTDVTDIKNAEKALQEEQRQRVVILDNLKKSEASYKILFNESRDAIIIITREGKFVDANQAFLDMVGINKEDLEYVNFWNYALFQKTKYKFVQDMEKHKFLIDFPFKMKTQDGTQIDCLVTSSVRYDRDGNIVEYQGIIRDITETKRLQKRVLEISERQQREIGQALHDGLGQLLTGIALKSKFISQSLTRNGSPEAKELDRLKDLANEAVEQTRQLTKGLVPGSLQANGLLAALEELSLTIKDSYGIACDFHSGISEVDFDSVIANQLYYIAQEAAINAVKHSGANRIALRLDRVNGGTVLSVDDNGIGFTDTESPHDGRGINIMGYRAKMIDSTFHIRNNNGKGTSIVCMVPGTT